jgi:hypothetical protein
VIAVRVAACSVTATLRSFPPWGAKRENQWRRAMSFDRTEVAGIVIGIATADLII